MRQKIDSAFSALPGAVGRCGAILLLVAPLVAQVPFEPGGPGVDPASFHTTLFASGLNYPKGMAFLPDGSLLVATSDPLPGSRSFYSSSGTLVRLVDADEDGLADGPAEPLFSGLPGSLSGLKVSGALVFVVSTAQRISILRLGEAPGSPLELEGQIQLTLPGSWLHPPSDLAVRLAPGAEGAHEVYFQLGSQSNAGVSGGGASLASDLGLSAPLVGDSIYRLVVTDHGDHLSAGGLLRIASGLRNAAGLAFQPGTGDLYFEDNGIDGFVDANEPTSADELNHIAAGDLGGDVEDFGFPASYIEYRTGDFVGGHGIPPLLAFQPLPAPEDGAESEGPAEIAFAPPGFPAGLAGGVFIGFHGKFNLGGAQNEENAVVFASASTGEYFHWIPPRLAGVGHLDGLLAGENALFLADLATTGSVSSGPGRGVIYRVKALAPAGPTFIRGDANDDDQVDLSDAVWTLGALFLGGPAPTCEDAADANDDGGLDISDPVATLLALFSAGPALPPPGAPGGTDPTGDELRCE